MAQIWRYCGSGVGWQLQLRLDPYAAGMALKGQKKKKKKKKRVESYANGVLLKTRGDVLPLKTFWCNSP